MITQHESYVMNSNEWIVSCAIFIYNGMKLFAIVPIHFARGQSLMSGLRSMNL